MKLTKKNLDFLDDLFDKLLKNTDKDMIDLHDSDAVSYTHLTLPTKA